MIEDGQVPFDELVELIGNQERIWARVGAALVNSEWTALAYDVVAPIAPPGWEERTWQYSEAVFCALTVAGTQAAEWLRTAKLTVCERELTLLGLQPGCTVRAQGLASGQQYGLYEPLLWPTTHFDLSQQNQQVPQKMLIAPGSPSFFSFLDAAVAFFGLSSNMPVSKLPSPSARLQDLAGRVAHVAVHPAHVEVRLEGQRLQGLVVELASRVPGPHEELSGDNEQRVRFDIPDGLAKESWVVLKSGSICVDLKFVNWIYSTPSAGVESHRNRQQPCRCSSLRAKGRLSSSNRLFPQRKMVEGRCAGP